MDLRLTRALTGVLVAVLTYAAASGTSRAASTAQGAISTAVPLLPPAIALPVPQLRTVAHTSLALRRLDLNVLDDHSARVAGVLRPGLAKRLVLLQAQRRGRWVTLAQARTGAHGRFVLRYTPRRTVSELVRVRFPGDRSDSPSRHLAGRLNVYRLALASWYGGGGSLACGGILTSFTMGVANKTLPCGTLVTLRYDGRTVRVPVIDRGPYVAGREFDLTEATKRALGFEGVGELWATS
ncbi:MAG TPA: septal ring lytic transglycosylase RlpA family protein [Solirubrobacteraceae bacterium]|jgi:hypothetical protein